MGEKAALDMAGPFVTPVVSLDRGVLLVVYDRRWTYKIHGPQRTTFEIDIYRHYESSRQYTQYIVFTNPICANLRRKLFIGIPHGERKSMKLGNSHCTGAIFGTANLR